MKDEAATTVRIPADLLSKIKKEAAKDNRTVSNWIINIIKKQLNTIKS